MQPLVLFGPLGVVDPFIEEILLVLALANVVTRRIAHDRHTRQAEDGGAEAMSRHLGHEATNVLLVVGSFYFLLVHYHGGFVMSMLVLGLVVTDFFEFEARKVEARTDRPIEMPKGALVASALVVGYAAFQALWYLVEGPWQAVVS
jgi:hypothetical protein